MQSLGNYMENSLFTKIKFLGVIARHDNAFKDTAFYFLLGVHLYILLKFDT